MKKIIPIFCQVLAVMLCLLGPLDVGAAEKYSPVKERARDFYAPSSEDLGPDEMRLIACGTGMPNYSLDE